MFNVFTLNSISPKIGEVLNSDSFNFSSSYEDCDAIVVRSAQITDEFLKRPLAVIARAGAGINNIPVAKCSENGIAVFNTPAANANAVKELFLCVILMAARNVFESIEWTDELTSENIKLEVEKSKKQFKGFELKGKTLTVIGLGAIGSEVSKVGIDLGMNVLGYDPYLTPETQENVPKEVKIVPKLHCAIKNADIISFHIPLNSETKKMINNNFLSECKGGSIILNMSRAEIANSDDIKNALKEKKISKYICDFPTKELQNIENVILTPHIGACTEEAEENCAKQAGIHLKKYLLYGNTENSINIPECSLGKLKGKARLCIIYKNSNDMQVKITDLICAAKGKILYEIKKDKGNIAYTVIDLKSKADKELIYKIESLSKVVRVRQIIT